MLHGNTLTKVLTEKKKKTKKPISVCLSPFLVYCIHLGKNTIVMDFTFFVQYIQREKKSSLRLISKTKCWCFVLMLHCSLKKKRNQIIFILNFLKWILMFALSWPLSLFLPLTIFF